MRRGNISSRSLPTIAFNLDNCFLDKKVSFFNRFLRSNISILKKQINYENLHLLYKIWNTGNYSISLVTFRKDIERSELERFLMENHFYFNEVEFIDDIEELKSNCILRYIYYVDSHSMLELPKNAITIDVFKGLIK